MADPATLQDLNRFNTIFKSLDDLYRGAARRFHLPECALWILYSLETAQRPLTQAELCQTMLQPKQSIHTALKKLMAEDLVCTHFEEGSKKSKLIFLTEKGLQLTKQTAGKVVSAELEVLSQMEPSQREMLFSSLERYILLLKEQLHPLFHQEENVP